MFLLNNWEGFRRFSELVGFCLEGAFCFCGKKKMNERKLLCVNESFSWTRNSSMERRPFEVSFAVAEPPMVNLCDDFFWPSICMFSLPPLSVFTVEKSYRLWLFTNFCFYFLILIFTWEGRIPDKLFNHYFGSKFQELKKSRCYMIA